MCGNKKLETVEQSEKSLYLAELPSVSDKILLSVALID